MPRRDENPAALWTQKAPAPQPNKHALENQVGEDLEEGERVLLG